MWWYIGLREVIFWCPYCKSIWDLKCHFLKYYLNLFSFKLLILSTAHKFVCSVLFFVMCWKNPFNIMFALKSVSKSKKDKSHLPKLKHSTTIEFNKHTNDWCYMALLMPNALIMSFLRHLLSKYKLLVRDIWQQHGEPEHVRTERQSLGFRRLNAAAQLVSCSEHQTPGLLLFKTTKYFCSYISLFENVNLDPCKIKPGFGNALYSYQIHFNLKVGWTCHLTVGYHLFWRDYVDFVNDTFRAMCNMEKKWYNTKEIF